MSGKVKSKDLPPGSSVVGMEHGEVVILHPIEPQSAQTSDYQLIDDDEESGKGKGVNNEQKSTSSGGCCTMRRGLIIFFTLCILAAVMFCLTKFVIGPMTIKSSIKNSIIEFNSLNVTEPADGSVRMLVSGVLRTTPFPFLTAVVHPVESFIYYNNKNMGSVGLNDIVIDSSINTVSGDSKFNFDRDVFVAFGQDLIYNSTISWSLKQTANVNLFMGSMLIMSFNDINIEKEIILNGCGGLTQTEIEVFDLTQSTPDKMAVKINARVFNPSALSLYPAGVLRFVMKYKGVSMGTLVSTSSNLVQGFNSLEMTGFVLPADPEVGAEMVSLYLRGIDVAVETITDDPASSISLYKDILNGLTLKTVLKGQKTNVVQDISFNTMDIIAVDNKKVLMNVDCSFTLFNPLGPNSPLFVHSISMNQTVESNGKIIGYGVVPKTIVESVGNNDVHAKLQMELTFIDDGTEFGNFMSNACKFPQMHMRLKGLSTTDVSVASIGYMTVNNLVVDNEVMINGLSGFPDVSLLQFSMPANNAGPDGGVAVIAKASFNNPSPAAMFIGDANFEMLIANDIVVGKMSVSNLSMLRGNNEVIMTGFMKVDGSSADVVGPFMTNYLNGLQQNLKVRGLNAGASKVNWIQQVTSSIQFSKISFPGEIIGPVLNSTIVGITIPYMDMRFNAGQKPRVKATMTTQYALPTGFPISLVSMTGVFGLALQKGANPVVQMSLVNVPITQAQPASNGFATVVMNDFVDIDILDQNGFAQLTANIMTTTSTTIYISGIASPLSNSALGNLALQNLIVKPSTMTTLNGFNNFPFIQLDKVSVVAGHSGSMELEADITMTSPSDNIACGTGDVELYGYYKGVRMMTAHLKDFLVVPGVNKLYGVPCTFTPTTDGNSDKFLSDFGNGFESQIELRGAITSSSIAVLQPAFQQLHSISTVPGLPNHLLTKIHLKVNLSTLLTILASKDKILPSTLDMQNPFPTYVKIVKSVIGCYTGDGTNGHVHVGDLIVDLHDDPMIMAPNGVLSTSNKLPVTIFGVDITTLTTFIQDLGKGGVTSLEGKLTIQMGGKTLDDTDFYETTIDFYQHNIPTDINYD